MPSFKRTIELRSIVSWENFIFVNRLQCKKKLFNLEIQSQGQFSGVVLTYFHQIEDVELIYDSHGQTFFFYLVQNNTQSHIVSTTRQKIKDYGWEVLPHFPYNPNLLPYIICSYHILLSISNF